MANGRWLRIFTGFVVAILFVLPLYWAVGAALGRVGAPPPNRLVWWPADPHWENFRTIFGVIPLARYIANSLQVVAIAVPLTWLTASWAGFALSQLSRRAQRRLVGLSAILLIIPPAAVWLIRFQIFDRLALLDTLWALIAPAVAGGSPLYVLLFYWTYRQVPGELVEAAMLDGATWWQIWSRIASPLARPTSAAVVVLAFVKFWSDFTDPVLYLFDTSKYTLPIGLQLIKQLDATNTPYLMTAAVIMLLPVLILFLFAQRTFLRDAALSHLLDQE